MALMEIPTISIAIPGSILDNAQSPELRAYLSGQIARSACIFQIDEVIVFDDFCGGDFSQSKVIRSEDGSSRRCCVMLARVLQYLECPQYLRKHIFPIHKDLQFAGLCNPLDAPHHLRQDEEFPFREGVTANRPGKPGSCVVNCGLKRDVIADHPLPPGVRVTVRLLPQNNPEAKQIRAAVVAPSTPRAEMGVYWGYNVRIANSLSSVFSQSPYQEGYDITIGTSDKGSPVHKLRKDSMPRYKHALVVFGGLQGLEAAIENDEELNVEDPSLLFDYYLNTCPKQGCRTIRTEEAVLISLTALSRKLKPQSPPDIVCEN